MRLVLWFMACLGLVPSALAQVGSANRLWWAEVELRGPLQGLVVDCGQDGELRLDLDLLAGETRRLELPLPLYAPLGAAGLAEIPLELRAEGAGSASLSGWVVPQPSQRFERLPPGLRTRSRAPAGARFAPLGLGGVSLYVLALLLLWAARRRVALLLGLGLFSLLGLGLVAHRRPDLSQEHQLLELDLERSLGFEARSALGRLPLPRERLEVLPGDQPLIFELELAGGRLEGQVLAQGRVLVSQEWRDCPPYGANRNPGPDLEQVWVRAPGGDWSYHGRWSSEGPLGPEQPLTVPPPSWLLEGLPPGRGALFGRFGDSESHWIRALGFNPL